MDNFYFNNGKCLDINMMDPRGYDCVTLLMYQDYSTALCLSQFSKILSCSSCDIWKFNENGLCPIDFINYQSSKNEGAHLKQLKPYLSHLITQYKSWVGQPGLLMKLIDSAAYPPGALN